MTMIALSHHASDSHAHRRQGGLNDHTRNISDDLLRKIADDWRRHSRSTLWRFIEALSANEPGTPMAALDELQTEFDGNLADHGGAENAQALHGAHGRIGCSIPAPRAHLREVHNGAHEPRSSKSSDADHIGWVRTGTGGGAWRANGKTCPFLPKVTERLPR